MNIILLRILFLFFPFVFLLENTNGQNQTVSLTVTVTNIKTPGDSVRILLWKGEKGFPKEKEYVFRKKSAKAVSDTVIFVFSNLQNGDYAVSCFYDKNNNRKYDRSFWSKTAEPFGLSGNPDYKNLPVKYKDCKIELNRSKSITVKLHYTSEVFFLFGIDK